MSKKILRGKKSDLLHKAYTRTFTLFFRTIQDLITSSLDFIARPVVDLVRSVDLVLKEMVLKYTREKSNIHCAMVDLSKAIDKINYNIMIIKLRGTSLPLRLLICKKEYYCL